jgi:hypothetical protein
MTPPSNAENEGPDDKGEELLKLDSVRDVGRFKVEAIFLEVPEEAFAPEDAHQSPRSGTSAPRPFFGSFVAKPHLFLDPYGGANVL